MPNTQGPRRSLLFTGVAPLSFLLKEEFTVAQANPIHNVRSAEPGPGTWNVMDTNELLTITGGKLSFPSPGNTVYINLSPRVLTNAIAVTNGTAFITSNSYTGGSANGLFQGVAASPFTARVGVNPRRSEVMTGAATIGGSYTFGSVDKFAVIYLGNCYGVFSHVSSTWTLQNTFLYSTGNHYGELSTHSSAAYGDVDYFYVSNLGTPWDAAYALATSRSASAAAGDTTATEDGDGLVEATWAAATGETWELSFRRTDDDNRWIMRCSQSGGTVKLIERNAGVETERASFNYTLTNGTSYRLCVNPVGNVIKAIVQNAATYAASSSYTSYTSSGFNATATGVKTSHAVTNLITWPRTLAAGFASVLDSPASYVFQEDFTTSKSAPIVDPRVCDPGPGSFFIDDMYGCLSISNGNLVNTPAGGAGTYSPAMISRTRFARRTGLAIATYYAAATGDNSWVGFSHSNILYSNGVTEGITPGYGLYSGNKNFNPNESAWTGAASAVILRSNGSYVVYGNRLCWVGTGTGLGTTMTPIVGLANRSTSVKYVRVAQLGAPWNNDYGLCAVRNITASAGATFSSVANAFVEVTWTAVTGQTFELMVRRTDDSNCWIIRCSQGGSTIKLIEKNAGTETERATAAQTWTNAVAYGIYVQMYGNSIKVYTSGGGTAKNTYASATFNNTATGYKVSHDVTEFNAWYADLPADAIAELAKML